MKNLKKKLQIYTLEKIELIKKIPSLLKIWIVSFVLGIYMFIKNLPKHTIQWWKNKYKQVINLPNTFKKIAKNIKELKLKDYLRMLLNKAILISLLIIIIVMIFMDNTILSSTNALLIINQSSTKLIIALGTGIIIIGRGTDLSAGRVVGLTAMIAATFSQEIAYKDAYVRSVLGNNPIVIILLSMTIGATIGIINGIIVTKFKVTPFIATLALMLIVYGFNIWYASSISNGQSIGTFDTRYTNFANKGIIIFGLKFTWLIFISLGLAYVMWIVWTKISFGKKLFAVGGNPKAANVSGISVTKTLLITYVVGGALYGLAGTLEAWRVGAASVNTGTMYELDAIAACIVGGLSFDGGKGHVSGILLGVLIFQTITFGFAFLGFSSSMTYIIKGTIIASAVSLDMIKSRVRV